MSPFSPFLPLSPAIAFKEALDNFRSADNGRFNHEFF
jgi:hypothetical protein